MRTVSSTRLPAGHCATRIKPRDPRLDAQLRQSTVARKSVNSLRDACIPHVANANMCVAVAASMALCCPQALASNEGFVTQREPSNSTEIEAIIEPAQVQRYLRARSGQPCSAESSSTCLALRDAPQLAITDVADAAFSSADPASYLPEAISTGTYVPGPVEVGWQIYVGSAVAAFPFVIGAYEFGKRILIQRRCEKCEGTGLLKNGKYYRKCNECGGFFPWQGWRLFFTSTASPGNGGPLLQPRGQTSVLYKVPPKKRETSKEDDLVKTSLGSSSSSAEVQSADHDGPP